MRPLVRKDRGQARLHSALHHVEGLGESTGQVDQDHPKHTFEAMDWTVMKLCQRLSTTRTIDQEDMSILSDDRGGKVKQEQPHTREPEKLVSFPGPFFSRPDPLFCFALHGSLCMSIIARGTEEMCLRASKMFAVCGGVGGGWHGRKDT